MSKAWPEELRLVAGGQSLHLTFDDGSAGDIAAELLRVESPSAEVKGHGPGQEQLVFGKRRVRIKALDPVGNYAVRIIFDDGHDTGLYTWDYLWTLMKDGAARLAAYEAKLTAAGLGRG